MKKKILSFTSIRSDYDLMSGLFKILNEDPDIDLRLIVSGAHMSHTYGYSVDLIEKDNLNILLKLETLIDSDTPQSRLKTGSLLFQNSIDIIAQFNPDLMIYAGDREDVIIASIIGAFLGVPTIHFYGGDHVKDGHVDNPIRHATSKLSTIHCVSIEEHKIRLQKMGEMNERIHVIGNIALDKFVNQNPIAKSELLKQFNKKADVFGEFALLIYHPIAQEKDALVNIFSNILEALKRNGINAFISYPNTDPYNKQIIGLFEKFKIDDSFVFYKNLDRELFLSIYKNCKFIIGNSSSGIMEAASIPIPAINVGLRQLGRMAPDNVIFCGTDNISIDNAIKKAISKEFSNKIINIKNPYGDGNSCKKAYNVIKTCDFKKLIYKTEDILELR